MDGRREYECLRKRRYRAQQRNERDVLQAQVYDLQKQLETQLPPERHVWRVIAKRAAVDKTKSVQENATLRDQVRRTRETLRVLRQWATMACEPHVPRTIGGHSSPWLHTTLVADPVAREQGYRWLTDRVFHSTQEFMASDHRSTDFSVDDVSQVDVRTTLDSGEIEILGLESNFQRTFFIDFKRMADVNWAELATNAIHADNHVQTIVRNESLMYIHTHNRRTHTNVCVLIRRYDLPHRVVIVRTLLRDDECIPLQDLAVRPHGFGWAVFEHVTDGVTLYRSRLVQNPPVRADGRAITFDETATLFGVEAHATARPVTLARLESKALLLFLDMRRRTDDEWRRRLHATTTL
ncbi:Aste57867_16453 [Aphanomyces stellatus]|uniref:Aste57867_16453 protein n=1 Tax=Aphanomyces stellatus TaxID=120398 RepID=A0A485L5G8_9STRA|nr:hypothetical protein As57867_016396 [Aphanomyces stellatus]VFT93227.1 Aste57867_16453 [Aphanomyces stellatus]